MVDTSKLDVEVVKAQSMKFLYMEDLQEAFGQLTRVSLSCPDEVGIYPRWVVFNPVDFYRLSDVMHNNCFYYETERRLIKEGVVGYLWGATVVLEDIPRGEVYVSASEDGENIFEPPTCLLRKVLFR